MKVYTKRGDSGKTDLIGGERVAKNSPNVEAYGTVDELMACVGVLIACGESEGFRGQLQWIQNRLMECASILAIGRDPKGVASKVPRIVESHVARTVCRRAERRMLDVEEIPLEVHAFINRLSDYFFVYGRILALENNDEQTPWLPN